MEVNDANMLILLAFAFMSSLVLMFGTLYYIAKMTRVFTNCQPTGQPVHSHNRPPGTRKRNKRENSVNLTVCAHNQHPPQENDDRF